MISRKEMLNIVRTEAIEHGGLQEVPGQQRGGKTSFHSAKRPSRGLEEHREGQQDTGSAEMECDLRLIKKPDGTFEWND
jgi:hypothetical protein